MLNDYHIFAIPTAIKSAGIGISFSNLENELGGGYFASVLFGSENGERTWKLTLPTVTGTTDRTVTGINGETLSWEEYLWDLFCEFGVNGTPFALYDLRSTQFYLVRFAQQSLELERMLTKLYTTGLDLKQWRRSGETTFNPPQISQVYGSYNPAFAGGPFGLWWSADALYDNTLQANAGAEAFTFISGDIITTTSGSLPIVRCNSTTDDGVITSTNSFTLKESYALIKIREAAFSADDGIITSSSGTTWLNGKSGTDEFYNLGFGAPYTYELDGIEYAESAQQAPMNQWGIVHQRHSGTGIAMVNLQLGADRGFVGRHAELDIAYLIFADELIPKNKQREIMEFLSILKAQLV